MGKQFQVKPKEAMQLEELEQRENRRRRTEKALFIPTVPKFVQKKYESVRNKIIVDRFNDKQKRERIIKKVFAYNKGADIADPMVRGGGM